MQVNAVQVVQWAWRLPIDLFSTIQVQPADAPDVKFQNWISLYLCRHAAQMAVSFQSSQHDVVCFAEAVKGMYSHVFNLVRCMSEIFSKTIAHQESTASW